MKKSDLRKFIENKKWEILGELSEKNKKILNDILDKKLKEINFDEKVEEFQNHINAAYNIYNGIFVNIPKHRWSDFSSYVNRNYPNMAKSKIEIIDMINKDDIEEYSKMENKLDNEYNDIRRTYDQILANLKLMTVKQGTEYLLGLGFNLDDLEVVEVTDLIVPINKKLLMLESEGK